MRERLLVLHVVAGDQPVDRLAGDAELAVADALDLERARRPRGGTRGTRRRSSSPAASGATGSAARHAPQQLARELVEPCRVALDVTITGTSSPSRSRHSAAAASRRLRRHEVGLREREHARQRREPRVVLGQLALDHRVVGLRVGAVERREVEHVDEQPRALDVREEVVAEAGAGARALDQPGDVGERRAGGRRPRACRAPARAS